MTLRGDPRRPTLPRSIFEASKLDDYEFVYSLLREGNDVDERNDEGLTCLHICSTFGCLETARVLVAFKADLHCRDRESGWTAMHRAVYFQQPRMVFLLLSCGAKLDSEPFGATPSMKSTPALCDKDGFTPLDLLSWRLSSGASPAQARKATPRGLVAVFGKADVTLGIPLPKSSDVHRPKCIERLLNENVAELGASRFHSAAVTAEGALYTWGHGKYGRLGHGNDLSEPEPRLVLSLSRVRVVKIAIADFHSIALCAEGEVYTWGSNSLGQLGHGQNDDFRCSPRRIESLRRETVVGIAAGEAHSLCFTENGDMFAWGSNEYGQLGIKSIGLTQNQSGIPISFVPKKVPLAVLLPSSKRDSSLFLKNLKIAQVVASHRGSLLLCHLSHNISSCCESSLSAAIPQAELYQWGDGMYSARRVSFAPRSDSTRGVEFLSKSDDSYIVQVAAGKKHFVALSKSGLVFLWEKSEANKLHEVPRLVENLLFDNGGGKVVWISAFYNRSSAVTDTGNLLTWEIKTKEENLSISAPTIQKVFGIKKALKVVMGADHALVLLSVLSPKFRPCLLTQERVPSLQTLTQMSLFQSIHVNNVFDTLSFLVGCNAALLEKYCWMFMKLNLDLILVQSNPLKIEKFLHVLIPSENFLVSLPKNDTKNTPTDARPNITSFPSRIREVDHISKLQDVTTINSLEELNKLKRSTQKKLTNIEELSSKIERNELEITEEVKEKIGRKRFLQVYLSQIQQQSVRLHHRKTNSDDSVSNLSSIEQSSGLEKDIYLEESQEKYQNAMKSIEASCFSPSTTAEKKVSRPRMRDIPSTRTETHSVGQQVPNTPSTFLNKSPDTQSLAQQSRGAFSIPQEPRHTHYFAQQPTNTHSALLKSADNEPLVQQSRGTPSTPLQSNKSKQQSVTSGSTFNILDFVSPKKTSQRERRSVNLISGSSPLETFSVKKTWQAPVVHDKKLSLSEIQQKEEMERLNSNITNLKGNHIPWHLERQPRTKSFETLVAEQQMEKQEQFELEIALKRIAEMEAKEAMRQSKTPMKPSSKNRKRFSNQHGTQKQEQMKLK